MLDTDLSRQPELPFAILLLQVATCAERHFRPLRSSVSCAFAIFRRLHSAGVHCPQIPCNVTRLEHAGRSSHSGRIPGSGHVGTTGTAQRVWKLERQIGRGSLRACGVGRGW